MKGILIDSVNREVKEIEGKNFDDLKRQMGVQYVCCGFTTPNYHDCFVDDEGLLNDPQHFFTCDFGYQPYAGNGLILKRNSAGNSISHKCDVNEIKNRIQFLSLADVQQLIRDNKVDYGTYLTTSKGTEKISEITLNAFEDAFDRN